MKKILVLFLLMLGFAFLGHIQVNAGVKNYDEAIALVEKANQKIEAEIQKAIEKEAKLVDHPHYEEKLDQIIEALLLKTNHITQNTLERLEKDGFSGYCEYVAVIIGDRIVYVDPIRVHRW